MQFELQTKYNVHGKSFDRNWIDYCNRKLNTVAGNGTVLLPFIGMQTNLGIT